MRLDFKWQGQTGETTDYMKTKQKEFTRVLTSVSLSLPFEEGSAQEYYVSVTQREVTL